MKTTSQLLFKPFSKCKSLILDFAPEGSDRITHLDTDCNSGLIMLYEMQILYNCTTSIVAKIL